jgi:hypothetical protein
MAEQEESFMESVSNYMGWTDRRGNANAVRVNYPTPQSVADDQTTPSTPAAPRRTTRELQAHAQIMGFRTVREWQQNGSPE